MNKSKNKKKFILMCPDCGLSLDDPRECSYNFDINDFYKKALWDGVTSKRIQIVGFENEGEEFLKKTIGKPKEK